jgi:MSHA biogenesis protein MshQ
LVHLLHVDLRMVWEHTTSMNTTRITLKQALWRWQRGKLKTGMELALLVLILLLVPVSPARAAITSAGSRILNDDAGRTAVAAEDVDVTNWNNNTKFLVTIGIQTSGSTRCEKDTGTNKLQWRNVTDAPGTWNNLGTAAGPQMTLFNSANLAHENSLSSTEAKIVGTGTYRNGEEAENNTVDNAEWNRFEDGDHSAIQFAIDPSDGIPGKQYQFRFIVDTLCQQAAGTNVVSVNITLALPTINQSAYRFFDNLDATNVGTALAAQNTAATLGANGAAFRLRLLLHVAASNLPVSFQAFKLQFATRSGTCDTGFVGETYADVTTTSAIAFNDNPAAADGAALTANASDPTHGADTVVNQTYEELNNFTNPTAIKGIGDGNFNIGDGKWDFPLIDNGAAGNTAFCFRVVRDTGTVINTYTVIPEITTAAGAVAAGGFNAYETSTAPGAITGVIKTKIAGASASLDIIALNTAKTAIETTFTGTVRVEVLNASDNSGALDGDGCRPTWTVIQTLAPDPAFIAGNLGRKTISFTQANSFPEARLRITFPAGAPTVTGCSGDNFAIRPNTFANFAVTDNDSQTAGTTRALNDVTFGTVIHKAGRPFSVRATAVNAAGTPATTTNYVGAPTATLTACAGAACTATFGTLTLGTTFAAGQLTSDVASHNNVGSFQLQLLDSTFASVDASDGSTAVEREITSAAIDVGRFVPDHFAVSLNTPQFGTACGSFTYQGQPFTYTTVPVITVTAQDFANNATTLYDGAWWRITSASLAPGTQAARYSAAGAVVLDVGALPATSLDPAIAVSGNGAGTLTFSSTGGIAFSRAAPVAPFDAEIALAVDVIDADGVAYAGNPAKFGDASAGNGIAFDAGKAQRFGRLRLQNAYGPESVALRVGLETQYWNGTGFVLNTLDACTSLNREHIALSGYAQSLNACDTAVLEAAVTLVGGQATLTLAAAGAGNAGTVVLTPVLGALGAERYCPAKGGGDAAAVSADRAYLQGAWSGAAWDDNPSGQAAYGLYGSQPKNFIFFRENY